jgi:hypothetical protein
MTAIGPSATFASRPLLKQDRTNRRAAGLICDANCIPGTSWPSLGLKSGERIECKGTVRGRREKHLTLPRMVGV